MTVRPFFRLALAAAVLASLAVLAAQPDPASISLATRFAKHEYMIAMRDGVKLYTAVYVPRQRGPAPFPSDRKDKKGGQAPFPSDRKEMVPVPIMLTRTPYGVGPYGANAFPHGLGPSEFFDAGNFILVHQDVRGRFMSEGTWVEMRPLDAASRGRGATDESTDTWDTIDWLVAHMPGSNGRVGIWGISYPGFYASAGLVGAHPALVAASPQAPVTDYYMGDDAYHNGAFMLAANFGFYASFYPRPDNPSPELKWKRFDYGTDDGYAFFLGMGPLANANAKYLHGGNPYWNETVGHPDYDAFWKARAVQPHLVEVTPAVMTVGGWYDAEDLQGPLRVYRRIEESSPGAVNRLVMGPWTHGGWAQGTGRQVGPLSFGLDTAAFFREQIERPFFERTLADRAPEREPEAWVFETGRDEWRRHEAWPPPGTTPRTLYFAADRHLADAPPGDDADAWDEYVSDPARPVPFIADVPTHVPGDWMSYDQRFAATRPDVLAYRSEPLTDDLAIAGPITVTLHVATTGTDSDFIVKLVDESPGASGPPEARALPREFQRLVRGEPFRGKYRHGFDRPEPFRPGEPDVVTFAMPDVYHTFRRAHRIVVHVQSSWFPLVDRNPQTFVEIPKAVESDFHVATERIYRSKARASSVTVGVVR